MDEVRSMDKTQLHAAFLAACAHEIDRADSLHGDAADLYEMLAILGEEFGELQQAVLDYDYHGGSRDDILKEAVQVGAMAAKTFRFVHLHPAAPRVDYRPIEAGDPA